MIKHYLNRILQFPALVLVLIALITAGAVFYINDRLIDDGGLMIDVSNEPLMKKGEDSSFEYMKIIEKEFQKAEKKGSEILIVFQPRTLSFADLDLYLKIDEASKWTLKNVRGLKKLDSLMTAKRYQGSCLGETLTNQLEVGNVCEPLLETYRNQLECVRNKEKYSQATANMGDEEETLDDDLEEESQSEDDSAFTSFVCSKSILSKTEKKLHDEFNKRFAVIFQDIKKLTMLHKKVISSDFKTGALRLEFEQGVDVNSKDIQDALQESMRMFREADIRVAWLSAEKQREAAAELVGNDMALMLPIAVAFMLISLFLSFRNMMGSILPFLMVIIVLIWVVGFMGILRIPFNNITMSLPILLLCVGNDYSIHFMNHYILGVAQYPTKSKKEIIQDTINHLNTPIIATGLTTIIGFAALTTNSIPAIRQFGLFVSAGVFASVVVTLIFLPTLLLFLPRPKARRKKADNPKKNSYLDKFLLKMEQYVDRSPRKIMLLWAVISMIAVAGIGMVRVEGEKLPLPKDHPLILDMNFIEENLSGLSSFMVIFNSRQSGEEFKKADVIHGLRKLTDYLFEKDGPNKVSKIHGLKITRIESVHEYIDIYRGGLDNLKNKEVRRYFDHDAARYDFPTFLSNDESKLMFLVYFNAPTISNLKLKELMAKKIKELTPQLTARFAGVKLLNSEIENNIISGQIQSLLLALAFILLFLSIMFMSLKLGAVSLLPNIIPLSIFFGTLGLLSIPIGVSISLIATIALGIGVDDTIHYLARYNENLKKVKNEKKAALLTIHHAGKPMTLTTISLGVGFLVLTFSQLPAQKLFGALMAYTFVVCLLTDVHFLPALMSKIKMISIWDYIGLSLKRLMRDKIRLFSGMSSKEFKLATLMAYSVSLKKGETLFKEKDIGHDLYVVLKGSVDYRFDKEFHKKDRLLNVFKTGDTMGEMGFFGDTPRAATAKALEDTELLALNREQLITRLFKRYPKIAVKLFANLAETLASLIRDLRKQNAQKRAARIIAAQNNPEQYALELNNMVEAIVKDGVLSIEEKKDLDRIIYEDGKVSKEERKQLERLDRMMAEGKLKYEKSLAEIIDEAAKDGHISVKEWERINDVVYADNIVNEEERVELNRLKKMIDDGSVVAEDPLYSAIFRDFKPKQIKWLKKRFQVKRYPKDARVFSQGDYGDYMLLILKGKFNLEVDMNGEKILLDTIFEGDVVGGLSMLSKEYIRSSSLTTLEDAEIIFLSQQDVQTMVVKNPKLAVRFFYNMLGLMASKLNQNLKELHREENYS